MPAANVTEQRSEPCTATACTALYLSRPPARVSAGAGGAAPAV